MTNTADELTEQTVASRQLFNGRLLGLRIDTVRLPEGMEVTREIVEHPGAAAVVPLTDDGQVLLVRQWRHPIGAPSLEIPAGTLDGSESPEACAERELCEEIGFFPGSLHRLGAVYVSPGYSDEIIHLYVASKLQPAKRQPDLDENLQTVRMTLEDAVAACSDGRLSDAKTITALLLTWQRQRYPAVDRSEHDARAPA